MAEIDPMKRLHDFAADYRTVTAAAKALGCSQQYLSDMLKGRRDISKNMLAKLGLKRIARIVVAK